MTGKLISTRRPAAGWISRSPKDIARLASDEFKSMQARLSNLRNIRKLVDHIEKQNDGCFWAAMYMVYARKNENVAMPEAEHFLDYIKKTQTDLLVPGTLMVRHMMLGRAFDLYGNLNMPVRRMTINNIANQILIDTIGEEWETTLNVPVHLIDTDLPLTLEGIDIPHLKWVHQSASNNSHTVADIGSRESHRLIRSFQSKDYRQIAIVEF